MILPDHPTPIRLRTHTITPVPFMIYSSTKENVGVDNFNEDSASLSGRYIADGFTLMNVLINE